MSKALAIYTQAFPTFSGTSHAYRAGVFDYLLVRLDGCSEQAFPYRLGSPDADAYQAGKAEGARLVADITHPLGEMAQQRPVYSSPGISVDEANRRALEMLRPFAGQPVTVVRQVLRQADKWLDAVTTLDCGEATEFARAVEGSLLMALPRKIEAPATNEERIRQGLRPRAKNAAE